MDVYLVIVRYIFNSNVNPTDTGEVHKIWQPTSVNKKSGTLDK